MSEAMTVTYMEAGVVAGMDRLPRDRAESLGLSVSAIAARQQGRSRTEYLEAAALAFDRIAGTVPALREEVAR